MPAVTIAPGSSIPASDLPESRLDAEKLDVYAVALEFQTMAARLVPRGHGALRDQIERASVSIVLNIAEGAGRQSAPDKSRFYVIARGSATESAAVVDILLARGLTDRANCRRARSLLVRIVQMLTRLVQRLSVQPSPSGQGVEG